MFVGITLHKEVPTLREQNVSLSGDVVQYPTLQLNIWNGIIIL